MVQNCDMSNYCTYYVFVNIIVVRSVLLWAHRVLAPIGKGGFMMELLLPNYADYVIGVPQRLVDAMSFDVANIVPYFIPFVLCMTFGYLLYTEAGNVYKREGVEPYPVYMHCWMITFDFTGTVMSIYMWVTTGFFWLWALWSIAFPIWMIMEAQSILRSCKSEEIRLQNFGKMSKEPISEKKALLWCGGMIVVCLFVNLWIYSLLGGWSNFPYYLVIPFSNYVFAIWTAKWWRERAAETGTRRGNSLKLQVIILIQISLMWIPGLSWYVATMPCFHNIWFYLLGMLMTALAAYNTYQCYKLPKAPEADKVIESTE